MHGGDSDSYSRAMRMLRTFILARHIQYPEMKMVQMLVTKSKNTVK